MKEDLISKIARDLEEDMESLASEVSYIELAVKNGDDITEDTEENVLRLAAGVISSVGALRALVEVRNDEDVEDDEEVPGEGVGGYD
jgi:hypothetical protein